MKFRKNEKRVISVSIPSCGISIEKLEMKNGRKSRRDDNFIAYNEKTDNPEGLRPLYETVGRRGWHKGGFLPPKDNKEQEG
jgi:hypothetical protein